MSYQLKIKSKHLAAESRIIRWEENKNALRLQRAPVQYREKIKAQTADLADHRKWVVGVEARATHLARAFLKGMPYSQVESHRKPEKNWWFTARVLPRVVTMCQKYGDRRLSKSDIEAWLST